jgi:hypothetical protein
MPVKVKASMGIIKSLTGQGKIIPGHCEYPIVNIDMTKVSLDMLKVSLDMVNLSLDIVLLLL